MKSGWMDSKVFIDWLRRAMSDVMPAHHEYKAVAIAEQALVLLDGFSVGHSEMGGAANKELTEQRFRNLERELAETKSRTSNLERKIYG